MSMSKQDFIALADTIKAQIAREQSYPGAVQRPFTFGQVQILADFCQSQNSNFKRDRWLSYINGDCGPNGGAIKK
jgi:hypothetical protein